MKSNIFTIFYLFFFIHFLGIGTALATENPADSWRLNEIDILGNGFLEKTAGDPFIVFPEITEPTCSPKGVQMSISFDPVPHKPILLEIFWTTDYLGFGEENKVFFVVHPNKDGSPNNIIVPLDHTAGFRQIRLDFPSYINSAFKVENYKIVSLEHVPQGFEVTDAFHNLSIDESLDPEILVPYILKAIMHGPKRMTNDFPFLFFWALLIITILFAIRASAKKISQQ